MNRTVSHVALCLIVVACHKPSHSPAPNDSVAAETAAVVTETKPESVDPAQAASLKSEIATLRSQISAAETESAQYSGGLVKALIESRVQIFKQTLAMLEQRDKAWTFGLRLNYTIDGRPFTLPPGAPEQLPEIERELRDLEGTIATQQAEVARYSGGLVQALSLSTLETMKQTQAMLNQRRLSIRFGLPQYLAFQNSSSAPATSAAPAAAIPPSQVSQAPSLSDDFEIISVVSRPGESNSSWTRFAWRLTLANKSAYPQKFDATIEFRDSDGFPVDSDQEYGLVVRGRGQETFTGEKLITASQVSRIASTAAKVKKRS
jgi:hypothetical protein